MKQVITLQNGSSLNEKQFVKYFEKKVLYTIRKFRLFENIKQRPQVQDLFRLNKINTCILSKECLDDMAIQILQAMMRTNGKKELKQLLPKYNSIIRPFYLISREEMLLYSRIKRIGYKDSLSIDNKKLKLRSELNSFLDELEKQQRNVKNSIVSSLLKIENLI